MRLWVGVVGLGTLAAVSAPAGRARAQGIVFDAASQLGSGGPVSSLTWSHKVGPSAGANRMLVVGVATSGEIAGVAYNAVAMTRQGAKSSAGSECSVYLFALADPPSGAHDVAVTVRGGQARISGGAYSFAGVDPTSIGPFAGASGSGQAVSTGAITAAEGEYVVDIMCQDAPSGNDLTALAATARQTRRWTASDGGGRLRGSGSTTPGSAAGTIAATYTSTGKGKWAAGGFALRMVPDTGLHLSSLGSAIRGLAARIIGVDL